MAAVAGLGILCLWSCFGLARKGENHPFFAEAAETINSFNTPKPSAGASLQHRSAQPRCLYLQSEQSRENDPLLQILWRVPKNEKP